MVVLKPIPLTICLISVRHVVLRHLQRQQIIDGYSHCYVTRFWCSRFNFSALRLRLYVTCYMLLSSCLRGFNYIVELNLTWKELQLLESSQYLFLILINSMQLGLIYRAPNQNSNHLEVRPT